MYLTKSWNYRNYKSFSLIQSHWRESCIKLFFQIDIFLNKETTSKVLYYLNRTTSAIVPLERSCFESFLVLILAQKATLMMMRYLTAFHHGMGSYFTIYIFLRSRYKGAVVAVVIIMSRCRLYWILSVTMIETILLLLLLLLISAGQDTSGKAEKCLLMQKIIQIIRA